MKRDNNRLLFFIKVPPPINGPTLMNQRVANSRLLRDYFSIRIIPISAMHELNEMGKYTLNKFKVYLRVIFKLINELIYYRPSVAYFQISINGVAFFRDIIYVTFFKLFRIKLLFHIRSMGIKDNAKCSLYRHMYRYAFNKSEVICLTKLVTDDIRSVFNGKIYIVNNGIEDCSLFNKYESVKRNKKIKILIVSNLLWIKGHDVFIEALRILGDRLLGFEANIVGAEGDLSRVGINQLIDRKNMSDRIFYVGPKYGRDKYFYFAMSDIFVLPTRHEVFPGVVLEAMQFGMPVIGTKVGGLPEIIDDGINGFIVDKNAPHQIAAKLELLIKNKRLRETMGREARKKYLEKYTFNAFENNMKEVFDSVLSNEPQK